MRFHYWEGGGDAILNTYILVCLKCWCVPALSFWFSRSGNVSETVSDSSVRRRRVNALWLHVRPAYCILFFLIWARRVCNIWLYARVKALFNVCGLPELLVLRSGLFLSELVIFLCLFLNPCFTLPGSHLQEEEMEEFGVSGWRQRTQTFILPLPFALFPTCYL